MRVSLVFLFITLLLAVALAQDSSEESSIPKKTLRKYRVRRPISAAAVADENGNASGNPDAPRTTVTRLRRIRIKQRPTEAPAASESPAVVLDEQYVQQQQFEAQQQLRPEPTPVLIQRQEPSQPRLRPRPQPQQQQQQAFYDDQQNQQVVEQVRNVPQYRTATTSGARTALLANVRTRGGTTAVDDDDKKSVGTTRNYSHINEDGSFTFGYEAEDGSFKEETRGTDCVVRGKYGYVDPDGVRREFTYVSGNPCDPNDPKGDGLVEEEEADERAAPPARAGFRRPVRPEITQNVLQGLEQTAEEKVPEDQLPALFRATPRQRRPNNQNLQPTTFRPRVRINPTPSAAPVQVTSPAPPQDEPAVLQPFVYTARPRIRPIQEVDNNLPQGRSLFNFQSELNRIHQQNQGQQQPQQPEAQAQVQIRYSNQAQSPQQQQQQYNPHAFPSRQVFPAPTQAPRLRPAQQPQQARAQIARPAPTPQQVKVNQAAATISTDDASTSNEQGPPRYGNYRTELVFDPNTNQYTSVLVQDIPKTNEEFTLTQRLRAFVEPQRPDQFQVQQFGQPSVQYFGSAPHLFNQQAEQTQQRIHEQHQQHIQQHQQLTQQQQQRQIQQQQIASAGFLPQSLPVRTLQFENPHQQSIPQLHADAQQIHAHAVNPASANSQASGQIDAFLRSLNISV